MVAQFTNYHYYIYRKLKTGAIHPKQTCMSKKNNVHIVANQGNWAVKEERNPKPLSTHQTQGEAIQSGK
jgi:hypothetical protein